MLREYYMNILFQEITDRQTILIIHFADISTPDKRYTSIDCSEQETITNYELRITHYDWSHLNNLEPGAFFLMMR